MKSIFHPTWIQLNELRGTEPSGAGAIPEENHEDPGSPEKPPAA